MIMNILEKITEKIKFVDTLKMLCVALYIVIAQLIWHCKEYALIELMNVKQNSIPYYIYVFGLGAILTIILLAIIIALKPLNLKKENNKKDTKIMLDIGIKNKNGEIPVKYKIFKSDFKENGLIIRFISKNIPQAKFEEYKPNLERAYDINIYRFKEIPSKQKYMDIYCVPKEYDTIRDFVLSNEDTFKNNFIHELVIGGTRSGKTYYTKGEIAKVIMNLEKINKDEKIELFIADFKNEDFIQFKNCPNYYGYLNAVDGISKVYDIMNKRAESGENNSNYSTIILLIDEYSSLLDYLSIINKTQANTLKGNVASLLKMGASKKIKLLVVDQGGYSEIFSGARLNFKSIAGFSQLNESHINMFFKDYEIKEINSQGEAYLWEEGKSELTRFRVVKYSEEEEKLIDKILGSKLS